MRGLRGAITVEENKAETIKTAVQTLVKTMLEKNNVDTMDIGAAIFSATDDITAAFPASGARGIPGFELVPLFDARQMAVDGAMPMCIRALILVDTPLSQREIKHVFLGRAASLRPDISGK